jgi:DNA-directed RNA polymerase subunit RPC12/RpoP
MFNCVNCGEQIEEQNKGGACALKTYRANCVPVANAVSIAEHRTEEHPLQCESCGTKMKVVAQVPEFVPCLVMKVEEEDYG